MNPAIEVCGGSTNQDAVIQLVHLLMRDDQQSIARDACANGTSNGAAALKQWVSSIGSLAARLADQSALHNGHVGSREAR
jgi:hypothetical protein